MGPPRRAAARPFASFASEPGARRSTSGLDRPDSAHDQEVHERDQRDQQEQGPADRRRVAELELLAREGLLVQVHDDRLVLARRAAGCALLERLEEVRLREELEPADRRDDDGEDDRVPQLRNTIIFTVIVSTIGGLQLFTEPYLFEPLKQGATGGSARQYQTVVMYLYEKAFAGTQFKFGYAAAIGWALFLLIAVISAVNLLIVRRIRTADA